LVFFEILTFKFLNLVCFLAMASKVGLIAGISFGVIALLIFVKILTNRKNRKPETSVVSSYNTRPNENAVSDQRQVWTTQIYTGVSQMVTGAPQMVTGAPQMVTGAPQMVTGAPQMVTGAPQMVTGAPQIVVRNFHRHQDVDQSYQLHQQSNNNQFFSQQPIPSAPFDPNQRY
jgi:hypothetical protein